MAILTPVIIPAKALSDGTHKIRLALSHRGQVRYITTDITISNKSHLRNGSITKGDDAAMKNVRLKRTLNKYQSILDNIDYKEGLTATEIVNLIKAGGNATQRTIKSVFDEYIDVIVKTAGSVRAYNVRYRAVASYIGDDTIMEHITHAKILGLIKYFENKRKYSQATVRMRLLFLKTLMNYAVRCGYVEYRVNPFNGIPIPREVIRQSWLTTDEIKAIRDVKLRHKTSLLARDLFMLSYYLGGINMADLIKINFKGKKVISYSRQKTEQANRNCPPVEFDIPDEAFPIINRLIDGDGYISIPTGEKLRRGEAIFSRGLPRVAESTGINYLIYYSARKSFAQHAYNLGVSTTTIDYILGHSAASSSLTRASSIIHYVKVTPDIASRAIRKVLDNLK